MTFNCKICNKEFKSYQSIWNHNHRIHTNEIIHIDKNDEKNRNFDCEYCNKKFTSKQGMEIHIEKTCKLVETKTHKLEKQIELLQKEIKEIKSSNKKPTENIVNNQLFSSDVSFNGVKNFFFDTYYNIYNTIINNKS